MTIKQQAKKFLETRRVVNPPFEVVKGHIVCADDGDFKVVKITILNGEPSEEFIDSFSQMDIWDPDDDQMILNFKDKIQEILGRKRYCLEKLVYQYLGGDVEDFDEYDDDFDDAIERAKREAEEEEAAEHEFDRFLRMQEE